MDIVNDTPFHVAPLPGRINFPGHSLTVIVKGTFDLVPDGIARVSDEQVFPTGDEHHVFNGGLDDVNAQAEASLRYSTDFAYLKPRADLLLAGHCHAPGGRATRECRAGFAVGSRSVELAVSGDRYWLSAGECTQAAPFISMPLCYERAFGGAGYAANPIGRGAGSIVGPKGSAIWPLPNIEHPRARVRARSDRHLPAGLGPLALTWALRYAKVGTYDGDYLERRWPAFAQDFDWSHFNAAPPPLQVEGYVNGDEPLRMRNLHARHPLYVSRLPGLRARAFVRRNALAGAKASFREVALNLDTVWVDMNDERLVLVWRGWCETRSEECEDIRHVFVMSEALEDEPCEIEQAHGAYHAKLQSLEAEWQFDPEQPDDGDDGAPHSNLPTSGAQTTDDDATVIMARPMGSATQTASDVDSQATQIMMPATEDTQATVIMPHGPAVPAGQAPAMPDEARTQLAEAGLPAERIEATGARADAIEGADDEALEVEAHAQFTRLLDSAGLSGTALASVDPRDMGAFAAALGAGMARLGATPSGALAALADDAQAEAEGGKLGTSAKAEDGEPGTSAKAEDGEQSRWTRERVAQAAARGESLVGEDLSGLNLRRLDLRGLDLTGARLDGAVLRYCDLTGATLKDASLVGANLGAVILDDANLRGADLTGSRLRRARLPRANLSDALLEGCVLKDVFGQALEASDAVLSEADLSGADLRDASLPRADLSGSILHATVLTGANLAEASLEGAIGIRADLSGANLRLLRAGGGCRFPGALAVGASAAESVWEEGDLTGMDFRDAELTGANFCYAVLKRVTLTRAGLEFARLRKADLCGAQLDHANLFQASLEKADLTDANLRGANAYGVEFLDAVMHGAALRAANLKRTKLSQRRS